MNVKTFEEFLESGIVKKQTPNTERALSLQEEAKEKETFLNVSLQAIPPEKMNANFIVDSCYDIILELVRAKMLLDGYNSGMFHEAEVSYLQRIGCSEADVRFMHEVRYYRNGTKYYGRILNKTYSENVLKFMKRIRPLLERTLL